MSTGFCSGCSRPIRTAPRFSGRNSSIPSPPSNGRCTLSTISASASVAAGSVLSAAPAAEKAASLNPAPSPAPRSATTSSPIATIRLTVSGEAATRRSYARLSLTTATFIGRRFLNARVGRGRTMPRTPPFVKSEPAIRRRRRPHRAIPCAPPRRKFVTLSPDFAAVVGLRGDDPMRRRGGRARVCPALRI